MKLLLFVCTGNSCRSPMAEAYFNGLAAADPTAQWRAASAGLCAWDGAPASPQSAAVMRQQNCALDGFHSRQLTAQMLREADLVVGMTTSHLAQMRELCPEAAERCHLLLEWAPEHGGAGVPDPFAGSVPVYERCFEIMKPALDHLFRQLNSQEN